MKIERYAKLYLVTVFLHFEQKETIKLNRHFLCISKITITHTREQLHNSFLDCLFLTYFLLIDCTIY